MAEVVKIPKWQDRCKYIHLTDLENFEIPSEIKYVAVDVETTGLERQHSILCGISFSWKKGEAYYISLGHRNTENQEEGKVLEFFNKHFADKTIVYWNARFDRAFMGRLGFEAKQWLDAAILSYNINIHRCNKLYGSLKGHCKKILELEMIEIWQAVGLEKKPRKDQDEIRFWEQPVDKIILAYACADADITLRLFNRFVQEGALDPKFERLRKLDHAFLSGVEYMEDSGMKLNTKLLEQYQVDIQKDMDEIQQEIDALVGQPINLGSHKQMTELLYTKLEIPVNEKHLTPKGKPSCNDDALKHIFYKYAKKYPALVKLRNWRKLQKKLTGYVNPLLKGISPRDNRIHPHYHTSSMITGRMSSRGDGTYLKSLNIQGIPKADDPNERYKIRNAFIPEKGFTWVSIDFSNIEIRIIANFSKDKTLIDQLLAGSDRHGETAKYLFGAKPSDPDWKVKRARGKTVNFNVAYTFGINELCNLLEISDDEGWAIMNKFFCEMYPTWGKYKKRLKLLARNSRLTTTKPFGRLRSLEYEYERISQGFGDRSALNHPIQGTCADLMRFAIFKCHKWIKDENLLDKIKMLSTIHDELNFGVWGLPGEEEFEGFVKKLKEIMEFTPKSFVVPVKANVSVGPSWGQAEERI